MPTKTKHAYESGDRVAKKPRLTEGNLLRGLDDLSDVDDPNPVVDCSLKLGSSSSMPEKAHGKLPIVAKQGQATPQIEGNAGGTRTAASSSNAEAPNNRHGSPPPLPEDYFNRYLDHVALNPERAFFYVEKRCATCDTTNTQQWRNGPLGKKTLCNCCGIRYQKEMKKIKN